MAITGIDTIEGKQIIAAGAVSAKSAEMAYNDENGNPITGYQVAGDYLTTADSANFYTTANESGFITGVDLTPYQTVEGMTAYQPVGDYLTTADSANFYTTANESGFITGVPAGTMNESAFEYDANDKISGYNGSAFAGGSDVPEGVMVESGLEYNAVNEISGYNGSAIAQYGAEKQFIVHDDTLVHLSNSAQYALGVNLSAVAQLLGVDETLLYSGTSTITTATLSEPATNFNRLRVTFYEHPTEEAPYQGGQLVGELDINECLNGNNVRSACMGIAWHNIAQSYGAGMRLGICYLTSPTTISSYHVEKQMNSTAAAGNIGNMWVSKVIGIGRKQ